MRFVRFGAPGEERPGLWLEAGSAGEETMILDARAMAFDIEDITPHFLETWGLERVVALLEEDRPILLPARGVRLGPPVARPGKIVCLGKNYADHAAEFDANVPETPILFSKAGTSINGPFDPIRHPGGQAQVDAEAELAVVIGKRAANVPESEALHYVAGYTVLNDVTDRRAQREGQQWFRGKSADTFCPLGPFLVTPEEIGDPHALKVYSKLNGELLQDGNTSDMLFNIPYLIAFLSATITLEPGDILATGTPAGVGFARKPQRLLQPGDTIEIGIDKVGVQMSPVVG